MAVGGLQRQASALRHGIARVDAQVEDRGLQLRRVRQRHPQPAAQHGLHAHGLAQRARDQLRHAGHELVRIDGLGRQRLLPRERQQPSHQRCGLVGTLQSAGEKSVSLLFGGRHASARQADAAGDDRQHVVEVVRDAACQLADRFHLLHLPHLLLGGVAFGNRVLQRAVGNGQLTRRPPGVGDPVGQRRSGQCECDHDCKREKGNGGTHGSRARVQQHLLCLLHSVEPFAQVLHQHPPAPFEDQATCPLEIALPAQVDGSLCQLQPLGNGCAHLGDRGDLLWIIGDQFGQCVQSGAQALVDPDKRLEKPCVARQDVAALPDFGILQKRPNLRD